MLGEGPATPAMPDADASLAQGVGQSHRTLAISLEQMKSHTLCGFRADAGQDAQGLDQAL